MPSGNDIYIAAPFYKLGFVHKLIKYKAKHSLDNISVDVRSFFFLEANHNEDMCWYHFPSIKKRNTEDSIWLSAARVKHFHKAKNASSR